MKLNLRHLEAFVAVARLSSFVKAARQLHISQPALTVQVRQLEDTLGVRLLDRNTRTVKSTQAGHELVPTVERLLREIDAIVSDTRALSERSRGLVTVAALPSSSFITLPKIVARFKRQHPGISVVLRDALAQRVLAMVKAEEADFGIGSCSGTDPEIQFETLFTDRMSAVFPPGSPLARKKQVGLDDVLSCPLILMSPGSSVRALVDRAFEADQKFVAPAYEVSYMSTAVGMVKAGLGVAILPSSVIEMGEASGLRFRRLNHPVLARDIGVIRKRGRSLSPAAGSFLAAVKELVKPAGGASWARRKACGGGSKSS